ncbi:hypothetical protein VTN00DRAFT_6567 [Thermoascus crustaceus]|uniref:uncharacterized protein n=1 Tax=Thermoascus crustaceus TaxID=5088 RepID=UPI0037432987
MLELIFRTEKPITTALWTAVVVIAAYCFSKCVYNLYLHPLSKFPGPKLAAIGSFYEFYYDVIRDGTYLWGIEKMHRKYGPIVRVTAKELHIHDPQYYNNVYAGGGRRVNKDPESAAAYTVPRDSIATVDHDLHRVRRGMMSPYFSKRPVIGLEPVIHERIGRLSMRLEKSMHQGQVIDLDSAFAADIVTCYFYGSHFD